MTSATSISRANTICRSCPWWCPKNADPKTFDVGNEAYTGPGELANSRFLDGIDVETAKARSRNAPRSSQGTAQRTVNYRLRDWLVSRQRPWGCPIPMVHCAEMRRRARQADLPVILPDEINFDVRGNPLDHDPALETYHLSQMRRQSGARHRHARHLRGFVLVFRPLLRQSR